MKKVYFSPSGRVHPSQWNIIDNPPEGYEFEVPIEGWMDRYIIKNDFIFNNLRLQLLDRIMPLNYTKGLNTKYPKDVNLIYSYNHIVDSKIPWMPLIEWFNIPVGRDLAWCKAFLPRVEKYLLSDNCKKILTWTQAAKESLLWYYERLDEDKIEVIPPATPPKSIKSKKDHNLVNLLFIGSSDDSNDFYTKGGHHLLEAFKLLKKRYNVGLLIKANIPQEVELPAGVTATTKKVSQLEIDLFFEEADIFVFPTSLLHNTVVIEAMSWGLPVVTTCMGSSLEEYIRHGVNGLVLPDSSFYPLLTENYILTSETTNRKRIWSKRPDQELIYGLYSHISRLIEHPELRKEMRENNLRETREGNLSLKERNRRLKTIFDEALR